MFAYCNNNPVISVDQSGECGSIITDIMLDALIGGLVSDVTTVAVGASWREAIVAFGDGVLNGAVYSILEEWKIFLAVIEGVSTFWECYTGGASIGSSLLTGGVAIYAGLSFASVDGKMFDLVVGTGMSLISESTTQAVQRTSQSVQRTSQSTQPVKTAQPVKTTERPSPSRNIIPPAIRAFCVLD